MVSLDEPFGHCRKAYRGVQVLFRLTQLQLLFLVGCCQGLGSHHVFFLTGA